MNAKRSNTEQPYAQSSNSFSREIDEDLRRQLASVGSRVRKQVSEGHLTAGTSLPSFQGLAVGTLDQNELRHNYREYLAARPVQSMNALSTKRIRDDLDDEYGDTEDDEAPKPSISYENKTYFLPAGHRSHSSMTDDFEEAPFLKQPPPQ